MTKRELKELCQAWVLKERDGVMAAVTHANKLTTRSERQLTEAQEECSTAEDAVYAAINGLDLPEGE